MFYYRISGRLNATSCSIFQKLLNLVNDTELNAILADKQSEWAMQKRIGDTGTDKKGTAWIDSYRGEVWDYNIAIAKEVAKKGLEPCHIFVSTDIFGRIPSITDDMGNRTNGNG